jgi:hypothetical protein
VTWEDLVNVLALWSIYLAFSNHHRCHGIEGGPRVPTSQGNRVRCDILLGCPLLRV